MSQGMDGLRVYCFTITAVAAERIEFGLQPGAQLRGAIYNALLGHFCSETGFEQTEGHQDRCPVCWLLATENKNNERGRDLPRPFLLQPPLKVSVEIGDSFQFEMRFIGRRAFSTFNFVIRALEAAGKTGVGFQRGRFYVTNVDCIHPFTDQQVALLANRRMSKPPDIAVTHVDVLNRALSLASMTNLSIDFLTPMRIGEDKHLAHNPDLGVLLRRLVERCQALAEHYGEPASPLDWRSIYLQMSELGGRIQCIRDETHWLDVYSGSRRRGTSSPIGGLVGKATWTGKNLHMTLPYLLWGEVVHVGKSIVKGNGWYRLEIH